MVRTRDLRKTFLPPPWPFCLLDRHRQRKVQALRGVTLDIDRGEIFGLIGPNGAGKSTLLKVLSTLIAPSAGTAEVAGINVSAAPPAVRRAVGLVCGDDWGFYWPLTGRENLEFFAGLRGCSPKESGRRAGEALESMGLASVADEPLNRYSAGMLQRLNVARALLGRPSVLFLDEPTRSLDPAAAEALRALVRQLARERQTTVVIATHNLHEAEELCGRVAVLCGGAIRLQMSVARGQGRLADRYRHLMGDPA